jgi:hypothetical protein
MTRFWMGSAAAVMAVSIAGLNAQSTGSQTPQTQTPQTPTSQQATTGVTTTVKGCVYKESSIPGRAPNVAEKAGVMEDYILVPAASHATTGTSGTTPPAAAGTAGATATHMKAFKLEKIADERLSAVVGKMVEVTGKVDADNDTAKNQPAGTSGTKPDASLGPDQIELDEFEVTDIKEVEGTCPATPQFKK